MHRGMGSLLSSAIALSTLMVAGLSGTARAQTDPFGLQQRADAASKMIVLGVQQGISSLPPTSGQAFTYDYNAELGTFVESEQLGPTVLRSTQTVGENRLSLRFATSYFDLNETFNPITYSAVGGNVPAGVTAYTQFGMAADAKVVLFNFGATYGITDRLEVTLNIPVSVVQAQASQTFLTTPPPFGAPSDARVVALPALPGKTGPETITAALNANVVSNRTLTFGALGADFNSGKNTGVGRISVGAKGVIFANNWAELAAAAEFFCNSPSQDQFAGSDSTSILPRLIGQVHAAKHLNLHLDIGEEHDFQVDQLSRFVWDAGVSIPVTNATFDFGVGGSKFDQSLIWTPVTAQGGDPSNPTTITALDANATELGTNYVDFLFGVKMRVADGLILGGAVNVPVTDAGFRAPAVGTVSLEYYFKAL